MTEKAKLEGHSTRGNSQGFTLLEVILALLIIGIFFGVVLGFFTEQWRSHQVVKEKMEAHYVAMAAGRMVSDAIRQAEHVEWHVKGNKWVLSVTPSGESFTDELYIEDKDRDGLKDLYRNHKNAHNPFVSGIAYWECIEGESGLWTISIIGKIGNQEVSWVSKVKPRLIDSQDL